jgi:hypothetical protein
VAQQTQKCLLCGQEQEPALMVLNQAICNSCEKILVASDCQDESYPDLLAGLCPLAKLILARAC